MARPAALLKRLDDLAARAVALHAKRGPKLTDGLSAEGRSIVQHWQASHSALERYAYVMEGDDPLSPLFRLPASITLEEVQTQYDSVRNSKIRII